MSQEMRLLSHRTEAVRVLEEGRAKMERLERILTGPGQRSGAGLRKQIKRAHDFLDGAIVRVAAVPITDTEKREAKKAKERRQLS